MQHSAEMRRCLIDCDVVQVRKLWQHIAPHLPQPETDKDALVSLHYARTLARFVPFRLRAYSHCWLTDQALPSGLPDHMRPRAQRLYPRIVGAVGTASHAGPGLKTAFNRAIEGVMRDAVLEAYADGHSQQPEIVKARILEKRADFKKRA